MYQAGALTLNTRLMLFLRDHDVVVTLLVPMKCNL